MKRKIMMLLPVVLISMSVGFILYRGMSLAEGTHAGDIDVTSGTASEAEDATSDAYGVPDVIYFSEPVESVAFSHEKHAVEMQFKCNTCHEKLFQMKAETVTSRPDFNMEGLNDGKYCGTCHSSSSQVAFSADSQCARCHLGVKGLEQVEEANKNQEG